MSEKLNTIKIKGKNYVQVNDRVKAFRNGQEWQGWSIITNIHELTDDVCVMCAKVLNAEQKCIATGWAREVRNDAASLVNKTSYVENCETSAVGRALGMAGFGIDTAVASADEIESADLQQTSGQRIDEIKLRALKKRCEDDGVSIEKLCNLYRVDSLEEITEKQHLNMHEHWKEIIEVTK